MMNNKNLSTFGLASAVLFSAASAFAQEQDVASQQSSLLQKLDSLNAAVLGLRINGTVKAGALASMSSSDQYSELSPTQENQAYSDANLVFTARPSSETQIHLELRLHKDWQSAFDENNNPVIGHWFSYDGTILNKHVDFNLGYMRVGYTPYTLYTPQQIMLQEPEIFAQARVESMAQRNLDTTSNRLMQGVNAEYHSGNLGVVSDVNAQITGARMRNTAKKYDQVFFDFDYADRYFYGLRLGAEAFGAHLGVNYTDVFDRQWSTRSRIQDRDTVIYEDNSILSVELGFDSEKLLGKSAFGFGLNGEFAMSNWNDDMDYFVHEQKIQYNLTEIKVNGEPTAYIKIAYVDDKHLENETIEDVDGTAFYVEPYVNLDLAGIKGDLKVMYLQNDEDFWSEMASTPAYRGGKVVLNANAMFDEPYNGLVNGFGMASLENIYFHVYNSNPLNATNLMTSETSNNALSSQNEDGRYMYARLYNNYKNAHFYRNGYNADVLKRLEIGQALFSLDPSTSMELPYGVATPDRKGIQASLNLSWNDAVEVNALFSMMNEGAAVDFTTGALVENNFTRYAVGLALDVGRFVPALGRKIKIQGSFDHTEEDAFLQRKNDRLMAGASIDVYGPVALLAGYQSSNREFGIGLPVGMAAVNKAEESLILAGPRVKIASNSYLSVQYGMLSDKVSFTNLMTGAPDELSIDKNVIVADVTVNF
ncbi:MAG: hypothetical protein MJZ26_03170 [Fibrobacter sp.]|nr:hypothetical protein [Fibrobacter sp.]